MASASCLPSSHCGSSIPVGGVRPPSPIEEADDLYWATAGKQCVQLLPDTKQVRVHGAIGIRAVGPQPEVAPNHERRRSTRVALIDAPRVVKQP